MITIADLPDESHWITRGERVDVPYHETLRGLQPGAPVRRIVGTLLGSWSDFGTVRNRPTGGDSPDLVTDVSLIVGLDGTLHPEDNS